jgi:hypothetical protein
MDEATSLSFSLPSPASPASAPVVNSPVTTTKPITSTTDVGVAAAAGLRRARTDGALGVVTVNQGLEGSVPAVGDGDGGDVMRQGVGGGTGGGGGPPQSLNGAVVRADGVRKVGLRDRIGCFQWTWFTMTMVRNVLSPGRLSRGGGKGGRC